MPCTATLRREQPRLDHYLLEGWEDGLATDLRLRLGVDFTRWESDSLIFDIGIKRPIDALKVP